MSSESLLAGEHAAWLDERYGAWLVDPASVDPAWRALFDSFPQDVPALAPTGAERGDGDLRRAARVVQLINAWRVRGHALAEIDPLGFREKAAMPALDPSWHGLGPNDLDAQVATAPLYGIAAVASVREVETHLRRAYAGGMAAEFMNLMQFEQRTWVQKRLETLPGRAVLTPPEAVRFHRKACDAENLERLLHNRFPGTKRFSLEGAESVVSALDLLLARLCALGVTDVVFGMSHRGRLNTLVNVFEKPLGSIIGEFQDVKGEAQGSGDVKYHLGFSAVVAVGERKLHLSLTPNPSHLEAVDPVVEGRVRAWQDEGEGDSKGRIVPLLIHGDAAFSGQGLVMETLNLSELAGYHTGGTIHLVINNQIGFTTPPHEARSTPYCTDVARMLAIPILHVNGEDPVAVAGAIEFAAEWRQTFRRDVVVDVYCYRKHGHNESDEPGFTQPLLYETIRTRKSPREAVEQGLLAAGLLTVAQAAANQTESRAALEAAADLPHAPNASVPGPWDRHRGACTEEVGDTQFDRDQLSAMLVDLNTVPAGFNAHPKIRRLLQDRVERVRKGMSLDWALAEMAAFGTLVLQGHGVRLSGQDSGRGTFSHRHAVLADVVNGREIYPLCALGPGRFVCVDSSLSEAGVLGFELGYAMNAPNYLVMWEAQFGDFTNGAQVLIDQFLTATEQKWGRLCALTLLLPHGYEGQGPEHSSARLERFLQQGAEDNIQVMNLSTPAQLFHALRRQVRRRARKPLVLMTPKSGLRHPEAVSSLDEFATGAFAPVLDDTTVDRAAVRRVVLCSGKVFFDLSAARRERGVSDVALVRAEQLFPWPAVALEAVLAGYPGAAEIVWCQEEPKNMGAWPMLAAGWFDGPLPGGRRPRYVGRPAAAAPSTGSHKRHVAAQEAVVAEALRF